MVTIPLFLLFRTLPKELLHLGCCDVFHCGFLSIFVVAIKFVILVEFCYGCFCTIQSYLLNLSPSQPVSTTPGRKGAPSQTQRKLQRQALGLTHQHYAQEFYENILPFN